MRMLGLKSIHINKKSFSNLPRINYRLRREFDDMPDMKYMCLYIFTELFNFGYSNAFQNQRHIVFPINQYVANLMHLINTSNVMKSVCYG